MIDTSSVGDIASGVLVNVMTSLCSGIAWINLSREKAALQSVAESAAA
jgi:hypothetical protein